MDQAGPKSKISHRRSSNTGAHSRLGGTSWVMDDGDPTITTQKTPMTIGPEYAQVEIGEEGDKTISQ